MAENMGNQKEPRYSIEEIKEAFWANFHKSGELFFNYLCSDEESEYSTNGEWEDFKEELQKAHKKKIMEVNRERN